MHPSSLDKENVLLEQKVDAFCCKQNPGTYNDKSEFFLDEEDVMYICQSSGKHQFVVPQTLVRDVIRQNHDPKFVAHPGVKRTHNLIALSYWWLHMRKTIEEYVRKCDSCQRRKESRESVALLGDVMEPAAPLRLPLWTSLGLI
jgi:hypothetical protein